MKVEKMTLVTGGVSLLCVMGTYLYVDSQYKQMLKNREDRAKARALLAEDRKKKGQELNTSPPLYNESYKT